MKYIHQIAYEDKEFKIIDEAKKSHGGNWHDFVLEMAKIFLKEKDERRT